MIKFTPYTDSYLSQLHTAFNEAFSTYQVSFNLPFDAFRTRILEKLAIEPQLSILAFDDDRCIGFILHTIGSFEGHVCVYNGGTGIIPEYRGRGISKEMYQALAPALEASEAMKIMLEVVDENEIAKSLYKSLGFNYRRTLLCFKKKIPTVEEVEVGNTRLVRNQLWDFRRYENMQEISTSFIDSNEHLVHNMSNEVLIEAYDKKNLVGYIVFQPHLGRVSQIAIKKTHRNKKLGRLLLNQVVQLSPDKDLTIINVPEDYEPLKNFLVHEGFHQEVTQYEMELII